MAGLRKAFFQVVWLDPSKFPEFAGWLKPDKNDNTKFQVFYLVHTTLSLSQKTEPNLKLAKLKPKTGPKPKFSKCEPNIIPIPNFSVPSALSPNLCPSVIWDKCLSRAMQVGPGTRRI